MLGAILLASMVSAATAFVLSQYFSVDVLSSLLSYQYADCWLDWGMHIGRHCFSDYAITVGTGMRPNPWDPYPMFLPPNYQPGHSNYLAAGMIPQMAFGLLGKLLGAPQLGLLCYLLGLLIAVLSPAAWASRGARGVERIVVLVALGTMAVPAWAVVDRGNSAGFVVPIALVFLVALCRRRWGLVAIMVVLAAMVKPQFFVFGVALLAARQWRWTGVAVIGGVITNVAAFLLWPRNFPETIAQAVHGVLGYGSESALGVSNVSFGRGLLLIPDTVAGLSNGGNSPDGFLAGPRATLGYVVLVLVVVCVLALGRRIPPVVVGIVLLATASLFPPVSYSYYLVFVLPVAALVVRDPDGPPGSGIFDRLWRGGGRRPAIGICVSLAAALTIIQIALPLPPMQAPLMGPSGVPGVVKVVGTTPLVWNSAVLTPLLWLVTCAVIIVSYARKPAGHVSTGTSAPSTSGETTSAAAP
jgi:hypothetical protein